MSSIFIILLFIDLSSLSSLIFEENFGMTLYGDLSISNYPSLERLIVKRNALKNLNSFTLSDNPHLYSFEVEKGDNNTSGAMGNVRRVIMSSMISTILY